MTQVLVSNLISIFRLPSLKSKVILKVFWILNFFWLILLLAFYIFQVNSIIAKSHLLKNYQKKLNELSQENETLSINLAKINSFSNLEKGIKSLGFQKADKIHYLKILEEEFVIK